MLIIASGQEPFNVLGAAMTRARGGAPGTVEGGTAHIALLPRPLRLVHFQRTQLAQQLGGSVERLAEGPPGEHRDVTVPRSRSGVGRVERP